MVHLLVHQMWTEIWTICRNLVGGGWGFHLCICVGLGLLNVGGLVSERAVPYQGKNYCGDMSLLSEHKTQQCTMIQNEEGRNVQ
jgi:hypothetical protein